MSDPPYGIGYVRGESNSPEYKGSNRNATIAAIAGDDAPFEPGHLLAFEQAVLFGADHYAADLPRGRWLAWDKLGGQATYGDSPPCQYDLLHLPLRDQ